MRIFVVVRRFYCNINSTNPHTELVRAFESETDAYVFAALNVGVAEICGNRGWLEVVETTLTEKGK